MLYVMKFDVAIMADNEIKADAKDVSLLVAIAMLIGFARKKHENVIFTLKTSENE